MLPRFTFRKCVHIETLYGIEQNFLVIDQSICSSLLCIIKSKAICVYMYNATFYGYVRVYVKVFAALIK